MKKNDFILIAALLIIACAAFLTIQFFVKKDGETVVVTVDRKEYAVLPLNRDTELVIPGINEGFNKLVVKDGKAYMTEADCPDKICVNKGKISKSGETIVCLPHKVVIELRGKGTELDGVVQ